MSCVFALFLTGKGGRGRSIDAGVGGVGADVDGRECCKEQKSSCSSAPIRSSRRCRCWRQINRHLTETTGRTGRGSSLLFLSVSGSVRVYLLIITPLFLPPRRPVTVSARLVSAPSPSASLRWAACMTAVVCLLLLRSFGQWTEGLAASCGCGGGFVGERNQFHLSSSVGDNDRRRCGGQRGL